MFKKNLWIAALIAALAMVFVGIGCDGGGESKSDDRPLAKAALEITDADAIGALLSAVNLYNANTYAPGDPISTDKNVAHFNQGASDSVDNIGFKIDFPQEAKDARFQTMTIEFEVSELTTLDAGKYAKIGFKSKAFPEAKDDMIPYNLYEVWFGTPAAVTKVGDKGTIVIPVNKPNKAPMDAVWFTHNKYEGGDEWKGKWGSDPAINYKLKINKILFSVTELGPCCTDCNRDTCDDCKAGTCKDECGTGCCLPPFTLEELKALTGIDATIGGETGGTWDAANKVAKFEITRKPDADPSNLGNQSTLVPELSFTWAQAGVPWDTLGKGNRIEVKYAVLIDTPKGNLTLKNNSGNDLGYSPQMEFSVRSASFSAGTKEKIGAAATGLKVVHNNWQFHDLPVYYIKVLSVDVLACTNCEKDICVCLPCNCFCAGCVTAGNCGTLGSTCTAGCKCDCHYWDGAGVTTPMTIALDVPAATVLVQFPTNGNDATQRAAIAKAGANVTFTYTSTLTTGFVALTEDQVKKVQDTYKYGGKVIVNITGSFTGTGANFRSVLGDVTKTSGWNASGYIGGGTNKGSEIFGWTTPLDGNNADLKHVLIQCQTMGSDATVITITGITITPVSP